jgi:outer membrane protein, heavy metal efflux system
VTPALLLGLLLAAGSSDLDAAPPPLPSPLTLARAEEIFLERGLDVLLAEAAVAGAEGDLRSAGAHPNPSIGGSLLYGFQKRDSNPPTPESWGFSAGITDTALMDLIVGKHSLRVDTAGRALAAAKQSLEDTRRNGLFLLRQAFTAGLVAERNVDLAREVLATYQEALRLSQIRYDKGDINGADLARIKTAKLGAEQALAGARRNRDVALTGLAFLFGVRGAPATFVLTGTLDFTVLPALASATPASLLALALENRADLRQAQAVRAQRESALSQAYRAVVPDVALSASYTIQTGPQGFVATPPTLQVGASLPVPLFYQQQGEIRRAGAELRAAEISEQRVRAQILSDVVNGWSAYETAKEQVERMRGELMEQATIARDLGALQYGKGAASLLEFLDVERTYIATNLEYRLELGAYWDAVYQLEQATGASFR